MTRGRLSSKLPVPLADLPLATFMRRHWQKRPRLLRQAVPDAHGRLSRDALFALAGREDVESRLVTRRDEVWQLAHGPFRRRDLPPRREPGWTLLVQGVDLHQAAIHRLLRRFRFVPDARLDDCMVSFATDGGGVGPHVDSYDVFLLQLHGRRRWRVGPVDDPRWVPDVPLKLLQRFEPTHTWDLEPGDMLYVPPGWGHDGIALGECMTCSVGYRAPSRHELGVELLARWLDDLDPEGDGADLYRDPPGAATDRPGAIPASLQRFARHAVERLLADRAALRASVALGLGEWLTEPKPTTVFEPAAPPAVPEAARLAEAVELDRRTRLMYDDEALYVNGEALTLPSRDGPALRRLADERSLPASVVARLGSSTRATLVDWIARGWAHPVRPDPTGGAP